jgi:hypothetical protein
MSTKPSTLFSFQRSAVMWNCSQVLGNLLCLHAINGLRREIHFCFSKNQSNRRYALSAKAAAPTGPVRLPPTPRDCNEEFLLEGCCECHCPNVANDIIRQSNGLARPILQGGGNCQRTVIVNGTAVNIILVRVQVVVKSLARYITSSFPLPVANTSRTVLSNWGTSLQSSLDSAET